MPAVFRQGHFSELIRLSGKEGARKILRSRASEFQLVEFKMGLADIDTPEDLENLDTSTL